MSKPAFHRSMKTDPNATSQVFDPRPRIPLSLEIEYYQQRVDEAAQRRSKKSQPKGKNETRRFQIAEDLRAGLPDEIVIKKWKTTRNMLEDLYADMSIGRI